ncbi:hypothetical protein RFI_19190 [Reticulomyxa filosa]|uniref:Uncharacterized protein n=1 Tax=Reticulomyxa filosa TaxID=46433 RepID=X6MVS4_RETFI|nr:hypothetical protein RFI_19190 [Reticulomyxa filosa]|eukprot:ETO18098.1 hypothetical protein RFI_19190 [Reticulomyxa filosa]
MFPSEYSEDVQQALEELFQKASEEMMVKVLKKQAKLQRKLMQNSKKKGHKNGSKNRLPRFLESLEHCLADPVGFHHLAIYTNEKHPQGVPLLEFHRAFQIYRSTLNPKVRKEVAHEICSVFLKVNSKFCCSSLFNVYFYFFIFFFFVRTCAIKKKKKKKT